MRNTRLGHRARRDEGLRRRMALLGLATVLSMLVSLFPQVAGLPVPTASAHNLQTRMVYMFFDPDAQACLDARIEGTTLPAGCDPLPVGWQVGDPLLQVGDELGVIIKVVPRDGTTTGVGGHIDFYVPNGVQVVDVGYVVPNGAGGYDKVAMKGQSPIAVGAGPIGAKTTAQLVGLNDVYASTASGLSSTAVNPATGLHQGTIAGVYGDTGIFYATDPATAYGSWQTFTGDSTANGCGSLASNPAALGKTLVNNSGDTVVPCNKWDATQLMAWGVKGGTYGQAAPIVDYADGRGNAPWGFASGVAGPESGYAWQFDWNEWNASAKNDAAMRAAMSNDSFGPWKRIQYDGDRVSYDQPGLISSVLGYASTDAGNLGVPVSSLPTTVSQTDAISPKAIRWAVGQLTAYRPEYAWVKVRVDNAAAGITNASGCPDLRGDTFGGDAGGTDNGKDHLWRYYEPTEVKMNMCAAAGKPATAELVKSGTVFQYPVKIYNLQDFALTNVVVRDILGSGLTFLSSVPAQNSGPNPLVWNVGTILPGQKFEALVTVRAGSSGYLDNCIEMSSSELPTQNACDSTISGLYPYLVPSKTARTTGLAPGAAVIYDVLVKNTGTGPTGSPVTIREFLPAGFTYDASYTPVVTVNGARVAPTVDATNPSQPVFTVPAAIQAGQQLTIEFRAKVDPAAEPGLYCNSYSVTQNGVPITTGSEACVQVAGGKIGDTVWRDWDGDGVQDTGEEGIAGVTVKLYASDGTTLLATTATDAGGHYYFPGLTAGTYVVEVNNGAAPSGTAQTGDPDATLDNRHTVPLGTDEQYLTADFGYQPTGAGIIGDKVFEDIGNDGIFDSGTDFGIPNVTVWLYVDKDGDGVLTPGVDLPVTSTTSDGSGDYSFTGLAEGYSYLAKVDAADPDIQVYFDAKYGGSTPWQLSTDEFTASPNLSGSDLDNDFGFWRTLPGSIGDQVFQDNNANGIFDAGDAVLPNVTVNLYRDTNGNGVLDPGEPLLQTTASDVDGQYTFANLGPGDYIVDVDQNDPDLPGGLSATNDPIAVLLLAGQNRDDVDFPFVSVLTKSVDKAVADPGDTLTFTITPYYPGPQLLSSTLIQDVVPVGTAFASAGQGGQLSPYTPQPAVAGSVTITTTGQGIYSINSNTPQYRMWDGAAFGAQTAAVSLGDTPNILLGAASPTRNEKIVVDITANNPEVQGMRWNGTSWVALAIPPATGTAGALSNLASNVRDRWGGAVAYEQLSGDALLVWNNTTVAGTNRLTWNTWNGAAWGTNSDISTTGEPRQLRLAARPNSDEMILVTSNDSAHDYARVWSGSSWSAAQTLENTSGGSNTAIGVAYEAQSGEALVVYGKAVATDAKLYYRTYSGGVWSAEQSIDPADLGVTTGLQWVSIAADPNDNDIVVGVVTSGGKTWLAAWDGAAWYDPELATATSLTAAALNVGVAFETASGQALAAYGVSGQTTVAYRTWTPEGGWTDEQIGPDIVGSPNVIALSPSPNSDRIILNTNDSANDAKYTVWDGDAWGVPLAASTNTGNTANQPVLFLWDRQQPPSSTTDLAASPTTVVNGGSITVQMTLRAFKRVSGVTPGTLAVTNLSGNTATATCGSPTPASQDVPANVPTTFTWTCIAASAATVGELAFSASASGAYSGVPGGAYNFASGTSNSVQLLALGDRGTVAWDLGANTAAEDGISSDPGAALCPVTVTLYPTADTYIALGDAAKWYGDTTPLVTRPASATSLKYALFKFDVSSLAGKTIQSAMFGANVSSARSSNHYDQIRRIKTAWTEGASATDGATWNDPNGTGTPGVWAGGAFSAADYDATTMYGMVGPEITGYYQYGDVTALVRDWTKTISPVANNGLALISTGTDGGDGKYYAREASGTATDPILQVTYLQSTPGGCGTNTTTLYAQGDTYIDEKNVAVNYGELTTFLTRPQPTTQNKYGLLWFDVRQVPPGATITSAVLDLLVTSNRTNHVDEVHVMNTPWYEVGASWNDSDANGSGDWATSGIFGSSDYNATSLGTITPSSKAHMTLDITGAVNNWVNNGVANRGLALISTGADSGDAKYSSRETALANRPKLTITWSLAGNPGPSTTVSFSAAPVLTTPGALKVTMTASSTSAGTITGVTAPSPLGIAGENGASAACGSATLKSADSTISSTSDPVIYEWTCAATAGSAPGSVTFSGKPTGTGGLFVTAASNSVLVTPPLTFTVTVNSPAGVPVVENTATIQAKEPDIKLGSDVCYAIADWKTANVSNDDILVQWTRDTGVFADVGTGAGTVNAESAVMSPDGAAIYTADCAAGTGSGNATAVYSSQNTTDPNNALGATDTAVARIKAATPNSLVLDLGATLPQGTVVTLRLKHFLAGGSATPVADVDSGTSGTTFAGLTTFSSLTASLANYSYTVPSGGARYVRIRARATGGNANDQNVDVDALSFTGVCGEAADRLGTINLATGVYTTIGRMVSTANPLSGPLGNFTTLDVDGLAFDPVTGYLYGVHRREASNTQLDVLFRINPVTGFHVEGAFAGADYVVLRTDLLPVALYDVDDIAFNPITGELYGIANTTAATSGADDRLVKINKATGAVSDVGRISNAATGSPQDDMEGLSFLGDGTLYGATGSPPPANADPNALWKIDPATAVATKLGAFPLHDDYEALACKSGPVQPGEAVIPPTPSNTTQTALTASIGDYVWNDADGDGVQDAGELPLAGVQVCATKGTDTFCDTTDGNGHYRIFGLGAGDWTVTLDLGSTPAGYQPTTPTSLSVTLGATTQYDDADFGLRPPGAASIGDTVCIDTAADGCDAGDAGLPFITVKLYKDTNNNGVIDAGDVLFGTTTTDTDGHYLFSGLYGGDYLVAVDETSQVTSPYGGTYTLAAAMDLVSGTNPHGVTLSDGQAYTAADFGYNWSGSIGDFVWWDYDTDGAQDEVPLVGIPNAAVLLYFDANGDGILNPAEGDYQVGFAMTDGNGAYTFENLPPGPYFVDVYEDSITTDGVRNIVPTTANVLYHELGAGETYLDADFGYYEGALVQGYVFHDDDRNGLFETQESGLAGITVTLTGTDKFGAPVSMTTTTGADGYFVFVAPEGDYTLSYSTAQTTAAGYPDATTVTSFTFHAYPGEDWYEQTEFDFGVDYAGQIGDTVWHDINNDSVFDAGEPGLAGVTVTLYQDNDNDGTLSTGDAFVALQMTDSSGAYLFEGLADGNYVVVVNPDTVPEDFIQTYDNAGGLDHTGQGTITGGAPDLEVDFGYWYDGSGAGKGVYTISGYVWEDTDGDGVFDGGELPIAGVRVTLACGAYGTYVLTTTSGGAGGNYKLENVPDGTTCTISVAPETLPSAAFAQTGDPDQPGVTCTTCDHQTVVTLSGASVSGQNFGYQERLGSISGTVCSGGANGVCGDEGEPSLADAAITLTWAGPDGILGSADDVTYPTQTTAAGGAHSFTDLQPGLYQIVETNPAGYSSLADADGGNPDNITVLNLGVGQDLTGQDFVDALPRLLMDKDTLTPSTWAGGQATYQIVVRNTGALVATGVTISDTLPASFTYASTTSTSVFSATRVSTANPALGATAPTWGNWDIQAGGAVTLTFVAAVGSGVAPGTYDNTAYADAANHALINDLGAEALDSDTLPGDTPETDEDVTVMRFLIGDTAWVDPDNNGTFDPGEQGLFNVPVTLVGRDVDGAAVNLTAYTNISGTYQITLTKPGVYTVTAPISFGGYQLVSPGAAGHVITLTVAAPQDLTADFSYRTPTSVAVFGFTAAAAPGAGAALRWLVTVPEGAPAPAFHLYRSRSGGDWAKLNALEPVGPLSLGGELLAYTFVDSSAQWGATYHYRLEAVTGESYGPYTVLVQPRRAFLPLVQN